MKRVSIIFLILYTLLSIYSLAALLFNWNFPLLLTPIITICGSVFSLLYGAFHLGWKRILILAVSCFIIALIMESVGVATGLVYGPYHYTSQLGPKFLGLVPYIIPVAWFMMMYPSLVIAARIMRTPDPDGWKVPAVAAIGGIIMTAWDIVMDPIMVLGGNWIWDGSVGSRVFFGIPLQNFWGWWLTTFLTFCVYLFIARKWARKPIQVLTHRTPLAIYIITGTTSVFSSFIMGLGGPALAGIFAMAPWMVIGMMEKETIPMHGLKTTWF